MLPLSPGPYETVELFRDPYVLVAGGIPARRPRPDREPARDRRPPADQLPHVPNDPARRGSPPPGRPEPEHRVPLGRQRNRPGPGRRRRRRSGSCRGWPSTKAIRDRGRRPGRPRPAAPDRARLAPRRRRTRAAEAFVELAQRQTSLSAPRQSRRRASAASALCSKSSAASRAVGTASRFSFHTRSAIGQPVGRMRSAGRPRGRTRCGGCSGSPSRTSTQ